MRWTEKFLHNRNRKAAPTMVTLPQAIAGIWRQTAGLSRDVRIFAACRFIWPNILHQRSKELRSQTKIRRMPKTEWRWRFPRVRRACP